MNLFALLSVEPVKELYDKMLKSVEARTLPPDAWLWSLTENCANQEDIILVSVSHSPLLLVSVIIYLDGTEC